MNTSAMHPNIYEGDLVLFYRLDKSVVAGDTVVLTRDGRDLILRVVATKGQVVDFSERGELLIDNYPDMRETFYVTEPLEGGEIEYPYVVKEGEVFVMSDFRTVMDDSRSFGAVPLSQIKGKVISNIRVRNV